jgi:hypothetical protein
MQKYVFFLNDYLKTKKSSVLTHNHLYNLLHEVLEVSLGTPSQIAAEEGAKTPADSSKTAAVGADTDHTIVVSGGKKDIVCCIVVNKNLLLISGIP